MDAKKAERIRRECCDLYNRNLQLTATGLKFLIDVTDKILCPLCFCQLSTKIIDPKTHSLDHIPPKKAGGRDSDVILVCSKCNNTQGHDVDDKLITYLRTAEVIDRIPGSELPSVTLTFAPDIHLNGDIRVTEAGELEMFLDERRTNPKNREQFIALAETITDEKRNLHLPITPNFQIPLPERHLINVALLRIAYLIYFRWNGYAAILHPNLDKVRHQILNPLDCSLLETWDVTETFQTKHLMDGVYFVYEPQELRCAVVKFTVGSKRRKLAYSICLPAHVDPGDSIYARIADGNAVNKPTQIRMLTLPADAIRHRWLSPVTHLLPYSYFQNF